MITKGEGDQKSQKIDDVFMRNGLAQAQSAVCIFSKSDISPRVFRLIFKRFCNFEFQYLLLFSKYL